MLGQPQLLLFRETVDMLLQFLALLFFSVDGFKLPNFKLDSDVSVDHHDSEVHDSLVNSSVQAFEFNLNLSSVNIAISILLLIFVVSIHKRFSSLVHKLSDRIDCIGDLLDMVSRENAI